MKRPDIESLRKLEQAATSGPWVISRCEQDAYYHWNVNVQSQTEMCITYPNLGKPVFIFRTAFHISEANLQYAIAAANAVPALLDYCEQLERQATIMRKALAKYADDNQWWIEENGYYSWTGHPQYPADIAQRALAAAAKEAGE
jgi:hypothetical protein